MKRIFIFAAMAAISLTACQQELNIEENNPEALAVFTATTESSATKTALSQNGENYDVLWQNEDQITIVDAAANVGIYQTASTTTQGSFSYVSGTAATTPDYKAWYPASLYNAGTPTLRATQEYTAGNIKKSPMYAESSTESLSFKNICGIIRLNVSTTMTGKKVRRIILSAAQPMSGAISNAATLASDSYIAAVSGIDGVTLDCGESGVAIGTEPTAFHFAVLADTYTGLKITVITTDGDFQTRTLKSDKSIIVGRSSIADVTIPFNSLAATNLSAAATANTYIVSSAGKYKFKATVKGNGGLDPMTGTTATNIDPASIVGVKVLWELGDTYGKAIKYEGGAYDISYADGYVYFSTPDSFSSGDACVAIYDSSDNILWSWVIWATPAPGTTTHQGATFMDRNLGAIDVGNCMRGFLYQWGRKDAFSAANGNYSPYTYVPDHASVFSEVKVTSTMDYTIAHPTVGVNTGDATSWMSSEDYAKLPWRDDVKTIYDPCPAGWRVPTSTQMNGMSGLPATGFCNVVGLSGISYRGYGNPGSCYYRTSTISSYPRAYAFNGSGISNWGTAPAMAIRPVHE